MYFIFFLFEIALYIIFSFATFLFYNSLTCKILYFQAYYLVRKGVPFRKAHHYIGAVVAHAERMSLDIAEIPLEDLQQICPYFDVDIAKLADYSGNVEQYDVIGGTATVSITEQLKLLQEFLIGLKKLE